MSSSSDRSLQSVGKEFRAAISTYQYFAFFALQFIAWKGVTIIFGPLSRFVELIVLTACVGLALLLQPTLRGVALAACKEATRDGPVNDSHWFYWLENVDAVTSYFVPLSLMSAHQLLRGYYWRLSLLLLQYIYIKALQYLWPYPARRFFAAQLTVLIIWVLWPSVLDWESLVLVQGIRTSGPLVKKTKLAAINRVLMEKGSSPKEYNLPKYAYSKLAGREIRLLRLRPFGFGVWCSLETRELDSAPPFEAISYRWGSGDRTHLIRIDGRLLPIQKSAFEVISSRISTWRPRRIWIDAICINQDDTSEKNVQVNLMRDVYSTADRTVAWLGHAPDARDVARLLFQDFEVHIKSQKAPGLGGTRPARPPKDAAEVGVMRGALERMLSLEYWERFWIIQEIAVSRQLDVWYGGLWFDWEILSIIVASMGNPRKDTLKKLYPEHGRSAPPFLGIHKLTSLAHMRERYRDGRLCSLARAIYNFSFFQATDDRDRVFAIKGVSADITERDIATDYGENKTVLAVFEEAVRFSLINGPLSDRFLLLSLAGISRAKKGVGKWPSWIPDLGQLPKCLSTSLYITLSDFAPYEASGTSITQIKSPLENSDRDQLIIRASIIDSIAHITKLRPSIVDFNTLFEGVGDAGSEAQRDVSRDGLRLVERHKEALALAESCCEETYFNGQSRWEAFWRTQLCNASPPDRYPAEDTLGEAYQAYMGELEEAHSATLHGTHGTPAARSAKLEAIVGNAPPGSLDQLIFDPDFGSARDYLTVNMLKDRLALLEEYVRLVSVPKQAADDLRHIFHQLDQCRRGGGGSASSDFQLPPQPRLDAAIKQLISPKIDPSEPLEMRRRKFWTMMALGFSHVARRLTDEQISASKSYIGNHIRAKNTTDLERRTLAQALGPMTYQTQFAVTGDKYMTLVPMGTRVGDIIAIFHGAKTPHALRPHPGEGEDCGVGRYKLMGEAYLHGFMDGEGFENRVAVDVCLV